MTDETITCPGCGGAKNAPFPPWAQELQKEYEGQGEFLSWAMPPRKLCPTCNGKGFLTPADVEWALRGPYYGNDDDDDD